MTLTSISTRIATRVDVPFVRAPEFVVEVIGYKPTATVRAHCIVCGWYGYETCHRNTATAHTEHLLSLHTCPQPDTTVTVS